MLIINAVRLIPGSFVWSTDALERDQQTGLEHIRGEIVAVEIPLVPDGQVQHAVELDACERPAFVVGAGGALRRVTLRTGIRDEGFAEVLAGELAPGDPLAVAYPRSEEPATPGGSSPFQARRPR